MNSAASYSLATASEEAMKLVTLVLTFLLTSSLAVGARDDFSQDYPHRMVLSADPSFVVHWKVDLERERIRFAVNASSRGWAGFGLSRTGQMIGSDVVIGWMSEDGDFVLHVRT